jgi:hypothetical protein
MPCSLITSQGGGDSVRHIPEGTCFVAVTDNSIHRDNRTIFRCSVAKELFLPQVRRSITLSELFTFASPARTFFWKFCLDQAQSIPSELLTVNRLWRSASPSASFLQ